MAQREAKIGDKVYYTGDAANESGIGIIKRINEATRYRTKHVYIEFPPILNDGAEPRNPANIPAQMLEDKSGPGQRFFFLDEWQAERKRQFEAFFAKYSRV